MVDTIIFVIVVILMVFAVKGSIRHFKGDGSCCKSSAGQPAVPVKKLDGRTAQLRLTVSGMHCTACEDRLHRALDAISGVAVTYTSYDRKLVLLDVDRDLPDGLLKKVVEGEGYALEKVEEL